MLSILSITLPIFIIIAIGFVSVRQGFFKKADTAALGKLVMNFTLPALLFKAVSERAFEEVINSSYLLAYGIGSLMVFAIGFGASLLGRSRRLETAAMRGMGMAMSNSAFVGYPLLLQFIGPAAGVAVAMTMLVENILMFPLVLLFAEAGLSAGSRQGSSQWHTLATTVVSRVIKNPLIIAIVAGVIFSLMAWRLPSSLNRVVEMMANASAAVALFVIGGALVGLSLKGLKKQVSYILLGKLLLHPLAVFLLLTVLPPMDRTLAVSAVILASAPMLSVYPVIGQKYGQEGMCAASLLATTVTSFLTISVVLWWIQSGMSSLM